MTGGCLGLGTALVQFGRLNPELTAGECPDQSRRIGSVRVAEGLAGRAAAPGVAQPAHLDQSGDGVAITSEVGDGHRVALTPLDPPRFAGERARGLRPGLHGQPSVLGGHHGVGVAVDDQQGRP